MKTNHRRKNKVKQTKCSSSEYWGRRPGSREPGKWTKVDTHRRERKINKKIDLE